MGGQFDIVGGPEQYHVRERGTHGTTYGGPYTLSEAQRQCDKANAEAAEQEETLRAIREIRDNQA